MKAKILILMILVMAAVLAISSSTAMAANSYTPPAKTPGAAATLVALGQLGHQGGKVENYKGVIASIDASGVTLTLKDESTVSILFDAQTRIRVPRNKDATFADLKIGMQAMVQARRAQDDSLTAKALLLIPGKPEFKHVVGTVTAYEPGVSITIQGHDDKLYTFLLTGDTKILPEEKADQLAVGTRVTIICSRDVTGGDPTAQGIVVHPAESGG